MTVAENIAGSFFKSDDRIHIIIANEAVENIWIAMQVIIQLNTVPSIWHFSKPDIL